MATQQQSNVELVREAYKAFNEGHLEVILERFDDSIEWVEPDGWPYGGTYHGPEAVVENVFKPALSDNEGFEARPDRFIDGGGTVVVVGTFGGTVTKTGERFDIPFAHVHDMEDGRVTRTQIYTDTGGYQQAAGA